MSFHRRARSGLLIASLLSVACAHAVEIGTPMTVPADTELVFEMVDAVNSKTNQRGDRFALRLAEPLRVDGQLLLPVGAPALGEVVHADRGKAGGQPGELTLAARYVDWEGRQIALRSFRAGVGRDRGKAALSVAIAAGVAGFLVRGGNIEMPAGTLITAKLRVATDLPVLPEPETPVVETTVATPQDDTAVPAEETTEETPGEIQP